MTDKQLHLLLTGMLDELAAAIAAAETSLATVGDQREQIGVPFNDDGTPATGLAAVGAALRGKIRYIDNPNGRFLALADIDALHESWSNRFTLLMDNVVAYDTDDNIAPDHI